MKTNFTLTASYSNWCVFKHVFLSVCPSCLQRQMSGEVRMQPQSSFIDPIAMTMATVGIGVSMYSARQMAERVQLTRPTA